jgi:hypothetical protein
MSLLGGRSQDPVNSVDDLWVARFIAMDAAIKA